MAGSKFSIGEAIRFGWSTTIANLGLFFMAMLVVCVISMFPVFFDSFVAIVVSAVLEVVVALGIMRMSLKFVDGDRGELINLFETVPLILSYFFASLLVGIITSIGFVLLVIPGIIFSVRLQLYGWAIVDRQLGPLEAAQESWEITRGAFWPLVGFWLVLAGVNIVGMLALGVGLLVTIPLSLVATGHVYRQLSESTG